MGGLDFARQGVKLSQLKAHDRLVIDPFFGDKLDNLSDFPCQHEGPILEVVNAYNVREAFYIAMCKKKKMLLVNKNKPRKVTFNQKKLLIKSDHYRYLVRPKNQILFKQISVRNWNQFSSLAEDSTMMIFSDLAYWPFDLNLDSSNIRSVIRHTWQGTVGVNIGVSFFLHIAMLKIDLSLLSDVSFYKDAAYIPMVLYFPVEAKKFLNPPSGIIYHWSLPKRLSNSDLHFTMPEFTGDPNEQKKRQGEILTQYCSAYKKTCSFNFQVKGEVGVDMNFSLSLDLVKAGFYPQYIKEPYNNSDKLGWELESNNSKNDEVGLFFRSANLTEGHHSWDLWLKPRLNHQKKSRQCPYPAFLRTINK